MAVSKKVAELSGLFQKDDVASWVVNIWDNYHQQRSGKVEEWLELRNYVFATDTTTTSNSTLPWKNSTTLPKLCQLRDNLHSNYLSSLFPNDRWMTWKGNSKSDSTRQKAKAIQAYMLNKCQHSHFRTEFSKLLYDYIDYGNVFVTVDYENSTKLNANEEVVPNYIGPVARRISPLDIVFNPLASNFRDTFKIVRSIKTLGEIKLMAENAPENSFWKDALARRDNVLTKSKGYTMEDFNKAAGFSVDGFGNLYEYYQSGYVEILEFYGDYHDAETGELQTNKVITVMDRSMVVDERDIPSWLGHAPIYHVGWRFRPDNLWAMGPLDNLVGMQYRIDHLENLKADAMDLCVHPPLILKGEVEEFQWGPGARIHLDGDGDVGELGKNLNGIIAAGNEIGNLEARMELYAGAPREAMGVRSPGEKTAFEVQTLDNASARIFQEKITNFEIELLEPCLNAMLETAVRNMNANDTIRTMDDDLGVTEFLSITRADITASGVLRPIGARHFGKQAQDLQNLIGLMNSSIGQLIMPHTSGLALTKFVEDVVNLAGYEIFKPNVAVVENADTQSMVAQAQEDLQVEASVPTAE
jgi:hypothetical protein